MSERIRDRIFTARAIEFKSNGNRNYEVTCLINNESVSLGRVNNIGQHEIFEVIHLLNEAFERGMTYGIDNCVATLKRL